MRNGRAARTTTFCDAPSPPSFTSSNRTRPGDTDTGACTTPVTFTWRTGADGSLVLSVTTSLTGPGGASGLRVTVTRYSAAPPKLTIPRVPSATWTSTGPCGGTTPVIFQSRCRPAYFTPTAWAGFVPSPTTPKFTTPGVTVTSARLTAFTWMTAVETYCGPKVMKKVWAFAPVNLSLFIVSVSSAVSNGRSTSAGGYASRHEHDFRTSMTWSGTS